MGLWVYGALWGMGVMGVMGVTGLWGYGVTGLWGYGVTGLWDFCGFPGLISYEAFSKGRGIRRLDPPWGPLANALPEVCPPGRPGKKAWKVPHRTAHRTDKRCFPIRPGRF